MEVTCERVTDGSKAAAHQRDRETETTTQTRRLTSPMYSLYEAVEALVRMRMLNEAGEVECMQFGLQCAC